MENAMLAAKSRAVTLDTESQKQVLAALVPLADRCWDYVQAMQQAGWDVVLPRLNFEASFGEGEVLREYRRYVLELAKVRIANPNIRFRLPEGKPYYSEFLNELRNRRDAEFKGRFEPQDMPIWAQELSICLRRKELLRYSQRSELERRFSAVKGEEQRRRIHEVARYATGASSAFGNELERPPRFYRAVTEREFTSSGFTFDNRRSIGEYVVLSKPLVAEWDLCLTPEPLAHV
jgi:hypothetical protein